MTEATPSPATESPWIYEGIDFRNLIWVALVLAVMVVVIVGEHDWLLRFFHIVSGILLTGADILFGFLIGPILRRMSFEARRQFTLRLLPKTLFILTPLGIIAPTTGWFLAGFRSRPQRTGTNSVTGAVRFERAGSSAWDDMSAQGSSVSIGSSESIAQGCAGAAKHRDVRERPSHEPQISYSPIPRQLIHSWL